MLRKNSFIFFALSTVLSLILATNASALTKSTLCSWGDDLLTLLEDDYKLSNGLYSETADGTSATYAWGQGIMLGAVVAAAKVDSSYQGPAESLANMIHSNYWYTDSNGYSGYNASANNGGDRYTDDTVWIVLAMLELYDLTRNESYLSRSEEAMEFIMSCENTSSNIPDGGIRWHETSTCGTRMCSTGPVCLANLVLYQETGNSDYFDNGLRLYDWAIEYGLKDSTTGLYHQGVHCTGDIDYGHLGYDTAPMMQAAVKLYQITSDDEYLDDAQGIARSLDTIFVDSLDNSLKQTGKWCGHDMANAFVDLYEVDQNQHWLDVIAGYLQFLHDYCSEDGLYANVWDDTSGSVADTLLENASVARAFWTLARTNGGSDPYYPVILFGDCSYGGWSAGLEYGSYNMADLADYGIGNDSISSIMVNGDYEVTLYDNSNFGGSTLLIDSDISCLVDESFNDKCTSLIVDISCPPSEITPYLNISNTGWQQSSVATVAVGENISFSPEPASGTWSWSGPNSYSSNSREILISNIDSSDEGNYVASYTNSCGTVTTQTFSLAVEDESCVSLFQHSYYNGWGAYFGIGSYTLADMISAGAVNDDATSVIIKPGYQVTFFYDNNFLGTSFTRDYDDYCFNSAWNDEISSMMVDYAGQGNDVVTIYQHCNYGGWAASYSIGSYTTADIEALGGVDNDASSLIIDAGYKIILYSEDGFEGDSITITSDNSCLVDESWNDVISSFKILVQNE